MQQQQPPQPTNIARLCGNYRSTCGYCDGSRAKHLCQHLRHQGKYYDSDSSSSSNNNTADIYNARNSSKCYAASFDLLSAKDYQTLLYKGWRRSGQHLYVPDNWRSCCPAIPIRLDVREFVKDKKQRRVWRNMDRALNGVSGDNVVNGNNGGDNGNGNGNGDKSGNGNGNESGKERKKRSNRRSDYKVNVVDEGLLEFLKCELVRAVMLYEKEHYRTQVDNNGAIHEEEEEKGNRIKSLVKFKVRTLNKSERKLKSHCFLNREKETQNVGAVYTAVCHMLLASNKKNTKGIIHVEDDMDAKTLGRKIVSYLQQHSSLSSSSTVKSYKDVLSSVVMTDSGHICFYVPTTSSQEEEEIAEINQQQQQQNIDSNREDKVTLKQLLDIIGRRESSEKNHKRNLPLQPHKMTVRSIPSNLSGTMADVHELHARYQAAVHGDVNPYEKLRLWRLRQQNKKRTSRKHPPNPTRSGNGDVDRLTLQGHDEDVDESESLSDIQQAIHTSRINFRRFLCDSPLPPVDIHSAGNETTRALFNVDEDGYDFKIPYGSYHQHYRIDGVLVAVGVIDVLPHGVSSVYSFYDPILSGNRASPKKLDCTKRKDVNPSMKPSLTLNLELGKYTALREIEWTRRASLYRPSLCNYFLGFYIHSCTKMRYKAEYKPSKLLCPIAKKWIDYEDAKPHMDANWGCCALISDDSAHSPRTHASLPVADHNRNGDVKMNGSNKSSSSFSIINMRLDLGQKRSRSSSNNGISNGSSNGRVQGNVTVGMLTSYGRAVVDPLVKDFVRHVGEEVARRCVLKLQ